MAFISAAVMAAVESDVSGFAPPGDIHRMTNTGDVTAISIHFYGTDVNRIGSSVRRYYQKRASGNRTPDLRRLSGVLNDTGLALRH